MKKLSQINENIFGDMLARGTKGDARLEDKEFVELVNEFISWHGRRKENYDIDSGSHKVDVHDYVRIYDDDLIDGKLPFKFGKVDGRFAMYGVHAVSLENCPDEVGGDFVIYENNIRDFVGGPRIVGGSFAANVNTYLKTLEGSPEKVGKNYSIRTCPALMDVTGITPDIGGVLEVGKDFSSDAVIRRYSNVKEIIKK